jgi:predicted component of type VI protein secretion system
MLLKVEQIDGKDSRELVKKDIKDADKDYSTRAHTLMRTPTHMRMECNWRHCCTHTVLLDGVRAHHLLC